jgi:hypothetical protein
MILIVDCGDLSEINNGSITLTDSNKSTYLSTATVDCDPGFRESIKVISCQANGQWQGAFCIIRGNTLSLLCLQGIIGI